MGSHNLSQITLQFENTQPRTGILGGPGRHRPLCDVVAAGGRAVPLSALISIFKWTQFLFESELKVKQLSRRKNEREREREREREKNPTAAAALPDFILLLLHAMQSHPLSLSLIGPLSELNLILPSNFAILSRFTEPKILHRGRLTLAKPCRQSKDPCAYLK